METTGNILACDGFCLFCRLAILCCREVVRLVGYFISYRYSHIYFHYSILVPSRRLEPLVVEARTMGLRLMTILAANESEKTNDSPEWVRWSVLCSMQHLLCRVDCSMSR